MKTIIVNETDNKIPSRHFGTYDTHDEWGKIVAILVSHEFGGFPTYEHLAWDGNESLIYHVKNNECPWDEVHIRLSDTEWMSIYPE